MLAGSSPERPSASGRPMSVEHSTSRDRPPMAWPSWIPNSIPPAPASIPEAPPIMADSSGGSCWVRASVSAFVTDSATGPVMSFQVSWVASIHSARDHAWGRIEVWPNSVWSASHSSARRIASSTAPRWAGVTDGSPSAAAICRAWSWASFQLTGPSDAPAPIMDWICWNIIDIAWGSTGTPARWRSSGLIPLCPMRRSSISWKGSLGPSPESSPGVFPGRSLGGWGVMGPPFFDRVGGSGGTGVPDVSAPSVASTGRGRP